MKIFCIGLQKTGTTSLSYLFEMLGFRVYAGPSYKLLRKFKERDINWLNSFINNYDVFYDEPFPRYYKFLNEFYPNSKFILTYRDVNDWVNSFKNYFEEGLKSYHLDYYGESLNEEALKKIHLNHYQEARKFFYNSSKVIEIDIKKEKNVERLCQFIETRVPTKIYNNQPIEFPTVRKGKYSLLSKRYEEAKKAVSLFLRKNIPLLFNFYHHVRRYILFYIKFRF